MKIGQKSISKVLLDVNVCIDVLTNRELTKDESKMLFAILQKNKIQVFIPAFSLDTIYYILNRMGVQNELAKTSIKKLIKFTGLQFLSNEAVEYAFDSGFADFEDSLINSVAVVNELDFIITSNTKDFNKSTLPIFHPKEFIRFYAMA